MRCTLLTWAILATSLAPPAVAQPVRRGTGDRSALPEAAAAASAALPLARWRAEETQAGDFTYDGIPDLALMGVEGATVYVVVVEGPVTERSRVFTLRLTSGTEARDSVCGPPADTQLGVEAPAGGCSGTGKAEPPECAAAAGRLPESARRAGAMGLALSSPDCDPFHVYFDGKGLAWWRL
jgi:hypothetical protein